MTDIHSHLLYGVDDGATSLEMARALLAQYAVSGVDSVICTPHQNKTLRRTDVLRKRFSLFQGEAATSVRLYLGAEIYYYEDMADDLKSGELLTMNGTPYVLVEFSTHNEERIPDAVYELSIAGYRPIVAHIERYGYLTRDDLFEIRENGGLFQVNARAFEHRSCAKLLKFLLKHEMLDFVASDCHRDAERNVDFTAAKAYILKKFPGQYEKLFGNNGKIFLT